MILGNISKLIDKRYCDRARLSVVLARDVYKRQDNYSGKFILDGLVSAGIIQDDSFQCIDLRLKADYDKKNPRTEVEVAAR